MKFDLTNNIQNPKFFWERAFTKVMRSLVHHKIRRIRYEREAIIVSEVGGMHTSILALTVAKTDLGKVIGKQGRTAAALQRLLSAVSAKSKKRALLEIVD